jgi:protein tyrosine kinase modulator
MARDTDRGAGLETVREVWRRRGWVGVVTFAFLAVAATSLTVCLPDLYRATATVIVERHQVPESFVRSSVTGELETRLQTISQEVLSRARLEELIARFDLYHELRRRAPVEAAVEAMRKDIRVDIKSVESPGGRASTVAFALSYRGRDPEIVAAVANTLASFYVVENTRLRGQQASSTAALLRGQLAEAKTRMDAREQRLREFRARWAGELPQQLVVNLATLERLHAQLHLTSANQLRALDRRAAIEKQLAELDANQAGPPETGTARLAKMKQELAELRRRYTDRYPDVARLRSDIAALEHDLAAPEPSAAPPAPRPPDAAVRHLRTSLGAADAEVDGLKAEEQRLRRDIATYQRRVESAPQREQELQEVARDYDTVKDLYGSLLKRYEDAQLADTMEQRQGSEQFRILDPALAPKEPVAPNRLRLLLGGFLMAIGLAVAAMMVRERLDTSFHTVDDLRALTTAPVLVCIPLIVTGADRWHRTRRLGLGLAATAVALLVTFEALRHAALGNQWLVGLLLRGGAS